jgi:hypothetical protein
LLKCKEYKLVVAVVELAKNVQMVKISGCGEMTCGVGLVGCAVGRMYTYRRVVGAMQYLLIIFNITGKLVFL